MIFDIPTPFDHGAIGGGAPGDTAAVQAALDAAAISPFRRCSLAGGTFMVNNVKIPADVTLAGPGLLIQTGGVFASVVDLLQPGASALDFEVDGNWSAQTTTNMGVLYGAADLTISGLHVHNVFQDGITATDGALRVVVEKNHIHNCGRVGATVNGTTAEHITHRGNFVHDVTHGGLGIVGSASHISFIGNHTKDTGGDGLAGYAAANRHISATGNVIENPGNHGIHLSGGHVSINANNIDNVINGHGIFFRNHDVSTMYGGTIGDNVIHGVTPGSGVRVEATERFTVTGNYIETGVTEQWGVYLKKARHGTVTGNTVVGPGGGAMGGEYATLIGGSSRIAIDGNTFGGYKYGIAGLGIDGVRSEDVTVGKNSYDTTAGNVYRTADAVRWDVSA